MLLFSAKLEIIGINPFVFVPDEILQEIMRQASREKSPIPVQGTLSGKPFRQTLVRYAGAWRLYVNLSMLKNSPKRIGETVEVAIEFDPEERTIEPPLKFAETLEANPEAKANFEKLPPSRQLEIARYLSFLKTEASLERNIARAIRFLMGKEGFVGRPKSKLNDNR